MLEPPRLGDVLDSYTVQTLEKHDTSLPGVSGRLYSTVDSEGRNYYLCTPFTLPPPNIASRHGRDFYAELQQASFRNPHGFTAAIQTVVNECVSTHALVQRVGGERLKRPPYTRPFPQNQCTGYLLHYGTTVGGYRALMDEWPDCSVCYQTYTYHINDACPGYLGERFLSVADVPLRELTRLLTFSNALPDWVSKHADSIFRLALERLHGKQKTTYLSSDDAGRKLRETSSDDARRSAAPPGDGPGDAVSGEP